MLGVANKPPRKVVGSMAFQDTVAMAAKLFTVVGFRVEILPKIVPRWLLAGWVEERNPTTQERWRGIAE